MFTKAKKVIRIMDNKKFAVKIYNKKAFYHLSFPMGYIVHFLKRLQ
jgi:hypothetical protein